MNEYEYEHTRYRRFYENKRIEVILRYESIDPYYIIYQFEQELLWALRNLEIPIDDTNPEVVGHIRAIRDLLRLNNSKPGLDKNECNDPTT